MCAAAMRVVACFKTGLRRGAATGASKQGDRRHLPEGKDRQVQAIRNCRNRQLASDTIKGFVVDRRADVLVGMNYWPSRRGRRRSH